MNKFAFTFVAATAAVSFASVAHADTATPATPTSIRLGAFFPSNGSDKTLGGKTQIAVGIGYALPTTVSSGQAALGVYFDYNGGNKNGGKVQVLGLGVDARTIAVGTAPYFGAGLGVYSAKVNDTLTSSTKTGIGGKVFAGVNFSPTFFGEVDYRLTPKTNGVETSGFVAQVGTRF